MKVISMDRRTALVESEGGAKHLKTHNVLASNLLF